MAINNDITAPDTQSYIEERNAQLKDISRDIIHKAWFTMSHLIMAEGTTIVDMGCADGSMTYAMAVLEPKLNFIGVEKDKRLINKAKEKYRRHNLEFKAGDASKDLFEEGSLDAIINSYVLHEIYSSSRYNEKIVSDTLRTHFKMLKKDGVMFIRDYSRPPPEEFIMMEMPDEPSKGKSLAELSEADLLVWYSEHARPRQDPGCGGFFLEELPSRFPKTRLFHLPFKWAYEFVMRKDDRAMWEKDLPLQYTFYTPEDFRKELRALGARVTYSGPHWNEDMIEQRFENKFRFFDEHGTPLGHPPTSYLAVAYKMSERKSLHITERRPSHTEESALTITAVRNQTTGEIQDIVRPDVETNEIIPYRINEEGRLKIYLHDGVARSIINAVPRNGTSIDRRRWSGHMIEPIMVDHEAMETIEEMDVKHSVLFARDYLNLKPADGSILERGPYYYPSPDYIDDRIHTYYLHVKEKKGELRPKTHIGQTKGFQAKGHVREMDAQQVLSAITVGMIPSARLELQLLSLYQHLGLTPENWTKKLINFKIGEVKQKTSFKDLMERFDTEQQHFKTVKGTAGQIRPVHSIFVEQGQTRGTVAGLTAQDIDFVVRDDQTQNTAIILPLTKGLKDDVHAGFNIKHLPIPDRHEGSGTTISAPSLNLPREITNLNMAKKFIADKYGVQPGHVIKLGESYFSHIGVTPHKIHPFAVIVPPSKPADPGISFLPFYQFMLLRQSLAKDSHFMLAIARSYQMLHDDIKLDLSRRVKAIVKQRFDQVQQDWSLPLNFAPSPLISPSKINRSVAKTNIQPQTLDKEELSRRIKAKHAPQPKKPEVEEPKEKAVPAVLKKNVKVTSDTKLTEEFEAEFEEFLEVLENHDPKPQPEKW